MILDNINILKLKKLGLEIRSNNNELSFSIFENDSQKNFQSNYLENPRLDLKKIDNQFRLIHWEWSPGPGPGDFSLDFESENETVDFIESYYFGINPYRETLKTYVNNNRNSYNSNELEFILKKLIQSIKNKFGEKEIVFHERGTYHKIHIDNWNITESKPEKPTITVDWGYLSHELGQLRNKLSEKEDFNEQDLEKIASLLMDLSLNLKKINCS